MKRPILILCFTYFMISINAQVDKFDFNDYTPGESGRFSRPLEFNDTLDVIFYHNFYTWSPLDWLNIDFLTANSLMGLKMKDTYGSYVVYIYVVPPGKQMYMQCVAQGDVLQGPSASRRFANNPFEKTYDILLIFGSSGIKLFLEKEYFIEIRNCIQRIPEIISFEVDHKQMDMQRIQLTLADKSMRVPGDWHIRKHIQMNHRIIIEYFPDNRARKCIITIRLADKNDIVALTVTIDYKRAFLLTKRDRYDDKDVQCLNFGSSVMYLYVLLGKIEIEIHPMFYKIRIETSISGTMMECTVEGHYYSPYDIYQAIFDSTEKDSIPYRYYIKEA